MGDAPGPGSNGLPAVRVRESSLVWVAGPCTAGPLSVARSDSDRIDTCPGAPPSRLRGGPEIAPVTGLSPAARRSECLRVVAPGVLGVRVDVGLVRGSSAHQMRSDALASLGRERRGVVDHGPDVGVEGGVERATRTATCGVGGGVQIDCNVDRLGDNRGQKMTSRRKPRSACRRDGQHGGCSWSSFLPTSFGCLPGQPDGQGHCRPDHRQSTALRSPAWVNCARGSRPCRGRRCVSSGGRGEASR